MSDYDDFAHLRRPVPSWWLGDQRRIGSYPRSRGLAFTVRRENGVTYRCTISRDALCGIARRPLSDEEIDIVWSRYQEEFLSIAKRKI